MGVWVAVRGRHFGIGARSAVVHLGHGRGPRSSGWALGAVRGHQFGPGAESVVVDTGQKRGLAVAQSSITRDAPRLRPFATTRIEKVKLSKLALSSIGSC